jgi:alpha-glucosidase
MLTHTPFYVNLQGIKEDDGVSLTTHASMHNLYQFLITKSTYEVYMAQSLRQRPQALARSGAPGIQRYGGALWSGDIAASAPHMARHFGTKKHLIMGGVDVHSSDIGGFHRGACRNDPQCDIGR